MSLQYDYTKCEKPQDDNERMAIDCLIWATIAVCMGEITEKNYREFYARIHTIELLDSSFRLSTDDKGNQERVYYTLEEVKRWIGLKTNVTTLSRAGFLKRVSLAIDGFTK
jgi:hypothetical protein